MIQRQESKLMGWRVAQFAIALILLAARLRVHRAARHVAMATATQVFGYGLGVRQGRGLGVGRFNRKV